jgi:hypothetical protein
MEKSEQAYWFYIFDAYGETLTPNLNPGKIKLDL